MEEYRKRTECATCKSKNLTKVIELGKVPLAGYFPTEDELDQISSYELNILLCEDCGLVQTDYVVSSNILFKDYRYLSSIGLTEHFKEMANFIDDKYGVKDKKILDVGCNDGVLLEPLEKLNAYMCVGMDPSENVIDVARSKGLSVINDYFNFENAERYIFEKQFDIITCTNTFAHVDDIVSVLEGVKYSLKDDGKFIIEVHYLKRLIEGNQWDNIYHEHIYYYSLTSLYNFVKKYDMNITYFEEIENHSGSMRVTIEKNKEDVESILDIIEEEKEKGLCDKEYFIDFSDKMKKQKEDVDRVIKKLKDNGKEIIGYGASGRANMFCNVIGLDSDKISYIIDESPERYNRYIANTDIPIYDVNKLDEIDNKDNVVIFILAYNYENVIKDKLMEKGFNDFMVAFPFAHTYQYYIERKFKK